MSNDYDLLMNVIRDRRSIRKFKADPVSHADIERILEAARWAPTAGNRQGFRFLVVTSPEVIESMARAVEEACRRALDRVRDDVLHDAQRYMDSFTHFRAAPVVFAPIHRTGFDLLAASAGDQSSTASTRRAEGDSLSSVSAAIMNAVLAAHTLGLGTCWMTGPLLATPALRAILTVPEGWALAALIPLGVPNEEPSPPPRRTLPRLWKSVTDATEQGVS